MVVMPLWCRTTHILASQQARLWRHFSTAIRIHCSASVISWRPPIENSPNNRTCPASSPPISSSLMFRGRRTIAPANHTYLKHNVLGAPDRHTTVFRSPQTMHNPRFTCYLWCMLGRAQCCVSGGIETNNSEPAKGNIHTRLRIRNPHHQTTAHG